MKLTTITARNFKGLTFTLELTDINFLVGSNFAGKTARTDAIRFLLLGYLPELGKTNTATFGLSSGREMSVSGRFDNGQTISRTRKLEGNSVKAIDEIPPDIAACGQLAVMLNAETYFALSDRARVDYVFANVAMGEEWTPAAILDKVISKELPAESTAKIRKGLSPYTDQTPQGFVDQSLEWLIGETKTTKAYAVRMEQTIQGLSALRSADDPSTALATLETERKALHSEAAELLIKRGSLKAAYDAGRAANRRRQELKGHTGNVDALESRKVTLQHRLDDAVIDHAACERVSDDVIVKAANEELQMVKKAAALEADMREVENQIAKNKKDFDDIDGQTTCPFCGATGDGWKALRCSELSSTLAGLIEKKRTIETYMKGLVGELEDVQTGLVKWRAQNHQFVAAQDKVNELKRDLTAVVHELALTQQRQQELAGLPEEDPQVTTQIQMIELHLKNNTDQLATIELNRKFAISRQGELKRLADAEIQRDAAKLDVEALIAVGKALREVQGAMVQAAFDPLLKTANRFFADVLRTPIAYHEGEIGTWRDGFWVTHKTFSGTEKLLTYAAIQAALASKSPVRIMILDELGRVDEANVIKMIDGIDARIRSKELDQMIGIDATNRYDVCFLPSETCRIHSIK